MGSRISLLHQEGTLRSYFPGSLVHRNGEKELTWEHTLHPTPFSAKYQVKLHYQKVGGKSRIDIYVLSPKLIVVPGAVEIPHLYDQEKQQLCLFYPTDKEWDSSMYYVHTIIPWISEWLYFYEMWHCCGSWQGGGIEHSKKPVAAET